MTPLEIRIKPKRAEVVTGESLLVEVLLENTGGAEIDVPDPVAGTNFEYTVFSPDGGKVLHHLSAAQAYAARTFDPKPRLDVPPLKLAGGATQAYENDLAVLAVPPLPPGSYLVSAAHQADGERIESPQVKIAVAVPRVIKLVAAIPPPLSPQGSPLLVGFVHGGGGGAPAAALQGESPLARPGDGPAHRRHEQAASGSALGGVALAVEQEDSEGVRWFAWRDGDAVGACLAQGKTTFREVGPVPLGLTAAELYPIGWQPSTQNAIFVARGTAAAGGPALAIVALSGQAGKGSARAIAVGGPAAPERWAVQRRGAAELDLVTAGAAAPGRPGVRVERQTITLASGKAGAPATLADHSGPLAALAAAPVAEPAGGVVDVLYGPSPQSGYMSFARLPLGGGPVRASWDFSPPAAPDPKRPTLWALPPAPLTPPLVVARAGDKIFARRAGGEWKVLATGAAQADQLRLAASPEAGAVAIWSDPTVGLRYLAIP